MRFITLLVIFFIKIGIKAVKTLTYSQKIIIRAQSNTLSQLQEDRKHSLVLYYKKQCQYCKNFLPTFKELCQELSKLAHSNHYVQCIKFDMSKESIENIQKIRIKEIPVLVFYNFQTPVQIYGGQRNREDLLKWVISNRNYGLQLIQCDQLDQFRQQYESVAVLFLGNEDNTDQSTYNEKIKQNLTQVSKKIKTVQYYFTYCNTYFNRKIQIPSLIQYSHNEDQESIYNQQNFDVESIYNFVMNNVYQSVFQFEEEVILHFISKQIPVLVYFTDESKENSKTKEEFQQAFGFLKKEIKIAVAHNQKTENIRKWLNLIDVYDLQQTRLVIFQMNNENQLIKYILQNEITKENIFEFFFKWKQNSLEPYIRSENYEVEYSEDQNFIKLVGHNFEKVVYANKCDAIVLFCPQSFRKCQESQEIFQNLALSLYHIRDLIFGRFDPEKNDLIEGPEIIAFPTVRFYQKGNHQKYIQFVEDFTYENLYEFIKKHTTVLDQKRVRIPLSEQYEKGSPQEKGQILKNSGRIDQKIEL